MPSEGEFAALTKLMNYRPTPLMVNPKSRSYPTFVPHITLATFDELHPQFKLEAIVPQTGLVVTHFRNMDRGNNYLGALKIQMDKTRHLEQLHEKIITNLEGLSIQWKSRSFPHMSLFYVDEAEERKRLERGLIKNMYVGREERSGRIILKAAADERFIRRFTGSEVWLADCCSKKVEEWKVLGKLSLSPPSPPPQTPDEVEMGGETEPDGPEKDLQPLSAYPTVSPTVIPANEEAGPAHRAVTAPSTRPRETQYSQATTSRQHQDQVATVTSSSDQASRTRRSLQAATKTSHHTRGGGDDQKANRKPGHHRRTKPGKFGHTIS